MMRASLHTSLFLVVTASWNSSGIAANFNCGPRRNWDRSEHPARSDSTACLPSLADNITQRGFDRGPVIFLRRRQLQTVPDARDLHVGEQRIGFLRLPPWRRPPFRRDFDGRNLCSGRSLVHARLGHREIGWRGGGKRLAQRLGQHRHLRELVGRNLDRVERGRGQSWEPDDRPWQPDWLQAAWVPAGACVIMSGADAGHAVAAENGGGGGAEDEGSRSARRW